MSTTHEADLIRRRGHLWRTALGIASMSGLALFVLTSGEVDAAASDVAIKIEPIGGISIPPALAAFAGGLLGVASLAHRRAKGAATL